MTLIRAQARFKGKSGDPEDVFVNTFHFQSLTSLTDPDADQLMVRLTAFYVGVNSPHLNGVVGFFSDFVDTDLEVRFYDLADLPPRVPKIRNILMGGVSSVSGANLPEEVAVCLSYSGEPPISPSRRGRIYLGPLCGGAFNAPGNQRVSVSTTFGQVLADAAEILADSSETVPWGVYSQTTGFFTPITRGYIDTAPDTQRRRGPDSIGRLNWTANP